MYTFLYLNFPTLAHFSYGGGFAEIVPQLNLNLLASADSYCHDVEDFEDYANNEFSLVLGGGYRFNFGLELDLRFQIGLTDVIEAPRNKHAKIRFATWHQLLVLTLKKICKKAKDPPSAGLFYA